MLAAPSQRRRGDILHETGPLQIISPLYLLNTVLFTILYSFPMYTNSGKQGKGKGSYVLKCRYIKDKGLLSETNE